jgi:hypothetical protein
MQVPVKITGITRHPSRRCGDFSVARYEFILGHSALIRRFKQRLHVLAVRLEQGMVEVEVFHEA